MNLDDLDVDWETLLDAAEGEKLSGVAITGLVTGLVMKDNWLPDHDYYEGEDGQDFEDQEGFEQAKETMQHFTDPDIFPASLWPEHQPSHPAFEYEFRAFLHNDEYSYSAALVAKLVQHVKGAYNK